MISVFCVFFWIFTWAVLLSVQEFYEDLFEELSKYGEIESLNICDNLADHMVRFVLHSFNWVFILDLCL